MVERLFIRGHQYGHMTGTQALFRHSLVHFPVHVFSHLLFLLTYPSIIPLCIQYPQTLVQDTEQGTETLLPRDTHAQREAAGVTAAMGHPIIYVALCIPLKGDGCLMKEWGWDGSWGWLNAPTLLSFASSTPCVVWKERFQVWMGTFPLIFHLLIHDKGFKDQPWENENLSLGRSGPIQEGSEVAGNSV